eukprot:4456317-Alexandrium_andersonii.AAC.1
MLGAVLWKKCLRGGLTAVCSFRLDAGRLVSRCRCQSDAAAQLALSDTLDEPGPWAYKKVCAPSGAASQALRHGSLERCRRWQ